MLVFFLQLFSAWNKNLETFPYCRLGIDPYLLWPEDLSLPQKEGQSTYNLRQNESSLGDEIGSILFMQGKTNGGVLCPNNGGRH